MPLISVPQSVWGVNGNFITLPPTPLFQTSNPTAALKANPGQTLVQTAAQTYWVYTGTQWLQLQAGGGGGLFANLTVNPGPTSLTGALTTISGANATNIATDVAAGVVNIGTAGARTVTLGSATGASTTVINSGTGDVSLIATGTAASVVVTSAADGGFSVAAGTLGVVNTIVNGPFTANTGTGTVNISTDGTNNAINIGTGTGTSVKAVTIGSTNAASVTTIQSGTGGLVLLSPAAEGVAIENGTQTASIFVGAANPNGALTGTDGSIYLRTGTATASTVLYVCTGGTTWTAVTVP